MTSVLSEVTSEPRALRFVPVSQENRPDFQRVPTVSVMERRATPPVTSPERPFDRIAIRLSCTERVDDEDDRFSLDRPLPDSVIPAPKFAARVIGQAIEVLLGHRPVRQLQSWLAPGVYRHLCSRAGLNARIAGAAPHTTPPLIRRLHVTHPRRRVAEVGIVIHDGFRIRAAALRLEIFRERWQVTALEIA
ncbi:Rv3235 family protein [Arcanobacterium haemolyticum]